MMRLTRNVGFLIICVVTVLSAVENVRAADCSAWAFIDCESCGSLEEEDCDGLCSTFHGEESPYYTEECDGWVYSQGNPSCGGDTECAWICPCAPDEA
jgi:hypothetical protein